MVAAIASQPWKLNEITFTCRRFDMLKKAKDCLPTTALKDAGISIRKLPLDGPRQATSVLTHQGFGEFLDEMAFWMEHFEQWSQDERPDFKDVAERSHTDYALLREALQNLQMNR
jgi:hypothetical protein